MTTRTYQNREIAKRALSKYPVAVRRLALISDDYNITYRVDTEGGERYALRVCRKHGPSAAEVRAEVAWCDALATESPVRVLRPLRTRDGDRVAEIDGRCCVLSTWVEGSQRGKGLTPRMLEAVGATMARLHLHGESWRPPEGWDRPTLEDVWLDAPDPSPGLPEPASSIFTEAAERLRPLLAALIADQKYILHADLHQGNYRFAAGHDVGVIDFDDCSLGHPAQDIAISWYYIQRHARRDALVEAFRHGYSHVRPWPTVLDPPMLAALLIWRTLSLCASVETHANAELRAYGRELLPGWVERCQRWLASADRIG